VTLIASLVLTIQAGWFTAGQPTHWHIERYVAYAAILIVTTAVVGIRRGFAMPARMAGTGAVLVLLCLLMPGLGSALEERAYYASAVRVRDLIGTGDAAGLSIAAALAGAASLAVLWKRAPMARATTGIAMVIGIVFLVQSEAAWQWQIDATRMDRHGEPPDLAWLRHDVGNSRDVAELVIAGITPEGKTSTFFSPVVSRVYGLSGAYTTHAIGRYCTWSVQPNGRLEFSHLCGPPPRTLYLDTLGAHLALRDETVLGDHGPLARVVHVPTEPRVLAYFARSCDRVGPVHTPGLRAVVLKTTAQCSGSLTGVAFPDRAATLRLTFRGGTANHYVAVGGAPHLIPAQSTGTTTVTVPIPDRQHQFTVDEDWTTTAGAPELVRADLIEPGHTQRVY